MNQDALAASIEHSMNSKDTDELLQIWTKNDRNEWSDAAMEVTKAVLVSRGVNVPAQGNPPEIDSVFEEPKTKSYFFGTIKPDRSVSEAVGISMSFNIVFNLLSIYLEAISAVDELILVVIAGLVLGCAFAVGVWVSAGINAKARWSLIAARAWAVFQVLLNTFQIAAILHLMTRGVL